jgi:hypothetical protein
LVAVQGRSRRRGTLLRSWTLDVREGWTAYLLLVLLVWVVCGTVAASDWYHRSSVLVPLGLAAMPWMILLAKISPRGTTYWLAVEASGVLAVFLATSNTRLTTPPASSRGGCCSPNTRPSRACWWLPPASPG